MPDTQLQSFNLRLRKKKDILVFLFENISLLRFICDLRIYPEETKKEIVRI